MDIKEIIEKYPHLPAPPYTKKFDFKKYIKHDAWKWVAAVMSIIAVLAAVVAAFIFAAPGIAIKWILICLGIYFIIAATVALALNDGSEAVGGIGGMVFIDVCAAIVWTVISFVLGLAGLNAWEVVGIIVLIISVILALFMCIGENVAFSKLIVSASLPPMLLFRYVLSPAIIILPLVYLIEHIRGKRNLAAARKYADGFASGVKEIAAMLMDSAIIGEMTEYFALVGKKQLKKITSPEGKDFPEGTSSFTLTIAKDGAGIENSRFTFASREVDDIKSDIELVAFGVALADSLKAELRRAAEEIVNDTRYAYSLDYTSSYLIDKIEVFFVLVVTNTTLMPKRSIYDTVTDEGGKASVS